MVKTGSTIAETLGNGETERWLFSTTDKNAVRVDISSGSQPYEVDILTADYDPEPGEFDIGRYSSVLADGSEEFTDTQEHSIGTKSVSRSVVVEVNNTSGGDARFTGSVSLHDDDAPGSTERFVTRGGSAGSEVYRDGAVSQRTIPGRTDSGGNPQADELIQNAPGQGIYLNLEPLGGTYKGTYTDLSVTTETVSTFVSGSSVSILNGTAIASPSFSNNQAIGEPFLSVAVTDTAVSTYVIGGFQFNSNTDASAQTARIGTSTFAQGWEGIEYGQSWVSSSASSIPIGGGSPLGVGGTSMTGAANVTISATESAPVSGGTAVGVLPWDTVMSASANLGGGSPLDTGAVFMSIPVYSFNVGGE